MRRRGREGTDDHWSQSRGKAIDHHCHRRPLTPDGHNAQPPDRPPASPARPIARKRKEERNAGLTAARRHRIVATCDRLRIPALAVPVRRRPRSELTVKERSLNTAHARLRCPVERGVATVKRWRILQHARCSPNWLGSVSKAILTLERQR
ncbi:transposase family protein [Kitasatospora sp. NPDC094011]|uniref:transposase family protein n=1 Tax=Kitasatospora sp. NPDC094011 TaxID=3364090 RepID=UPI00381CDEBA